MYVISQTFFVDRNACQGSDNAFLTSVDLYFKKKPSATNNSSGITNRSEERRVGKEFRRVLFRSKHFL